MLMLRTNILLCMILAAGFIGVFVTDYPTLK